MPRVRVVNPNDSWIGTEYYINGQKIDRVKSVDFRAAIDEVPTFAFEIIGEPDIDMAGDIRFSFTPETVAEAVKVLRNELLKYGDIYDAFRASVYSAAKEEIGKEIPNADIIASAVMRRIIGEE